MSSFRSKNPTRAHNILIYLGLVRVIDKNNAGIIHYEELIHFLVNSGERFTHEEAQEMISDAELISGGDKKSPKRSWKEKLEDLDWKRYRFQGHRKFQNK